MNENDNKTFRKRGKKLGILAAVAAFLFSGCGNIAWRDPFTAWRIKYKERKTIGKVEDPSNIEDYNKKIREEREGRIGIVQKLGLMNEDNPDIPNYSALVKKAKEMTDVDLNAKNLPYSLEELQAVYSLIKETGKRHSKQYHEYGLDTVEEKVKRMLPEYHIRLAGQIDLNGLQKYKHYLSGMVIARTLNDREVFDDLYGLTGRNILKTDRLIDTEEILLSYPDIYEEMRTGLRADNKAANTWTGGVLGSTALYLILKGVFDKEDEESGYPDSSGEDSGGGEGEGGPAGKGKVKIKLWYIPFKF